MYLYYHILLLYVYTYVMAHYVTYRKLKDVYDVQSETVRKWARQGLIRYKSIQHTTRTTWLYDMDSIGEFIRGSSIATLNESNTSSSKVSRVLYAPTSRPLLSPRRYAPLRSPGLRPTRYSIFFSTRLSRRQARSVQP
jgi:hypothetical protein